MISIAQTAWPVSSPGSFERRTSAESEPNTWSFVAYMMNVSEREFFMNALETVSHVVEGEDDTLLTS